MSTIYLLIRNKYRPHLFRRCVDSIRSQTYKDIKLIVACDSYESHYDAIQVLVGGELDYEIFMVTTPKTDRHYWNLYCNELKAKVPGGYFFVIDNDDQLAYPEALEDLSKHLSPDHGVICQFMRNGKPKPNDRLITARQIIKGHCGGGCLVLYYLHKDLADWKDCEAADYYFISEISKKVPLKFIHLILQLTDQKNNGK